ncbi:MAG TPA: isocitrate/isopropylmalate family dehydrogenase, partial [Segetibacter sp.]
MHKNIAVILGDGIGPEVTRQSVKVLTAIARQFNHQFNFSYGLMGAGALEKTGTFLPAETLNMCRNSDAVLFGALNFPQSDSIPSTLAVDVQGLAEIGKELGLFARICPITSYASLQHLSPLKSNRLENIDFVIFQEESGQNIGSNQHNVGTISENSNEYDYYKKEIKRIAHLAFAFTQKRRKQVTLINTSHASQTSQLWRKVVEEILVEYKDVSINYLVVENAVARIIQNPKQFDVILTDNISG